MKKSLFSTANKPLVALLASFIVICSVAWTSQQPSVKSYMTGLSPKSMRTTIFCASPLEFKKPVEMLAKLHLNIDVDPNKIRGIVFYHNVPKKVLDNSEIASVEAISIYYTDPSNFLKHVAYLKNATSFANVAELNLKADAVTFNDIHFIQKHLSKSKALTNYHYFSNLSHQVYTHTQSDLGLMRSIDNLYDTKSVDCPSPCTGTGGNSCKEGNKGMWLCYNNGCAIIRTEDNSDVKSKFSGEYLQKYLNLTLYRDFRDNFLAKFTIGKKYIKYYDALGEYLLTTDKFNGEIMIKAAELAPQLYKVVQLLSNDKASDEVVITENEKNNFLQILEIFKRLSDNKDYQSAISDIENDMNIFSNKTKSSLIEYLNKHN